MRRLTATDLATPPIRCTDCGDWSYAAARHNGICLLCEAKTRKRQGK